MGEAGLAGWAGTCARKERAVMTDPDRWHRWLLEVRFGGDAAAREKDLTEILYPVRDAVLDRARLTPGQTLLDVGQKALQQVLNAQEADELARHLRPLVESGA